MKALTVVAGLLLLSAACQTGGPSPKAPETAGPEDERVAAPAELGPDVIAFKDEDGNTISERSLDSATGRVDYDLILKAPVTPQAKQLYDQAKLYRRRGDLDSALMQLGAARELSPAWPFAAYDLAYTWLLKGSSDSALKYYLLTDQLAPKGFFTTKTAIYALQGENTGTFPRGTYLEYLKIDVVETDVEKLSIAAKLAKTVPRFAPAWKELALRLSAASEKLNAVQLGLACSPDPETKGSLQISWALVLDFEGRKEDARALLGKVIFAPDATTANIEMAKFLLRKISRPSYAAGVPIFNFFVSPLV